MRVKKVDFSKITLNDILLIFQLAFNMNRDVNIKKIDKEEDGCEYYVDFYMMKIYNNGNLLIGKLNIKKDWVGDPYEIHNQAEINDIIFNSQWNKDSENTPTSDYPVIGKFKVNGNIIIANNCIKDFEDYEEGYDNEWWWVVKGTDLYFQPEEMIGWMDPDNVIMD